MVTITLHCPRLRDATLWYAMATLPMVNSCLENFCKCALVALSTSIRYHCYVHSTGGEQCLHVFAVAGPDLVSPLRYCFKHFSSFFLSLL
jgi:hypothetical protein